MFERILSGLAQESLIRLKSVTPYWLAGSGRAVYFALPRQSEKLELRLNKGAGMSRENELFIQPLYVALETGGGHFLLHDGTDSALFFHLGSYDTVAPIAIILIHSLALF